MRIKVYLAGQADEYENNWKKKFGDIGVCDFHDWEIHSDQTSPDTYFPDDLSGVKNSEYLIANPGVVSSEGTWIEVGAFYAYKTKSPGEFCDSLIIIWSENRNPKWSLDFVKKTGHVVLTVEEAKEKLLELLSKR
ncbi:MAG: hypothetical protein WC835_00160 [Candidatus Paceibacterota bacterium]|jgi:hypothetical protein